MWPICIASAWICLLLRRGLPPHASPCRAYPRPDTHPPTTPAPPPPPQMSVPCPSCPSLSSTPCCWASASLAVAATGLEAPSGASALRRLPAGDRQQILQMLLDLPYLPLIGSSTIGFPAAAAGSSSRLPPKQLGGGGAGDTRPSPRAAVVVLQPDDMVACGLMELDPEVQPVTQPGGQPSASQPAVSQAVSRSGSQPVGQPARQQAAAAAAQLHAAAEGQRRQVLLPLELYCTTVM